MKRIQHQQSVIAYLQQRTNLHNFDIVPTRMHFMHIAAKPHVALSISCKAPKGMPSHAQSVRIKYPGSMAQPMCVAM